MRRFNTAGPCRPAYDHMIPPERRIPEAPQLIDRQAYFSLRAPRQTGKTTTLRALARRLTDEGRYAALHFSCETAGVASENLAAAEKSVMFSIADAARRHLPPELHPPSQREAEPGTLLRTELARWATVCPRPLVLIFDELDAIEGSSLPALVSQLRAGFSDRPTAFPWSVILSGRNEATPPASSGPFRREDTQRLPHLDEADLRALYAQHTAATGQVFAEDALARVWELTHGHPWLVNALAWQIVEKLGVSPTEPITAAHVDEAKERLIVSRTTHLDGLRYRLRDDRVQPAIEPLLSGRIPEQGLPELNHEHLTEIGLIAPDLPVRLANPIYRETILRALTSPVESMVAAMQTDLTQLTPDGRLDLHRLLLDFADFWREHGDVFFTGMGYPLLMPQLAVVAWLRRIMNGGGLLDQEVASGGERIEAVVRWPHADATGHRVVQRTAFELKVWRDRDKKGDPLAQGLQQIDDYLAGLGLDEGFLVIFDARSTAPPIEDRTRFEHLTAPSGREVTLLRA